MRYEKGLRTLLHVWFRFARPMTLGARVLALDGEGHLLLVKHTYTRGWLLPGGGVEAGETMAQAAEREVSEEGNVEIVGELAFFGLYFNHKASRRDHVGLYVARDVRVRGPRPPDREIAAAQFFPLDGLPPDTSEATRARIAEVFHGAARSPYW